MKINQPLEGSDYLIVPVLSERSEQSYYSHPARNSLLLVYARNLSTGEESIINLIHPELPKVSRSYLTFALAGVSAAIYDMQSLIYYVDQRELIKSVDVGFGLYHKYGKRISPIQIKLPQYPLFSNYHASVGRIINSVKKWVDENINVDEILSIINDDQLKRWNNLLYQSFHTVEKKGIVVNTEKFLDLFKSKSKYHVRPDIKNDTVYTRYNFNTITSRPSQAFNRVNFANLPHCQLEELFVPRMGKKHVWVDFDGMHFRIVSLLNKELHDKWHEVFSSRNIHRKIGELIDYQGDYNELKKSNFYFLYKGFEDADHPYLQHELFRDIRNAFLRVCEEYRKKSYIWSPIYHGMKISFHNANDIPDYKLINYIIQRVETEFVSNLIRTNIDVNQSVIYTLYDAILLEVDKDISEDYLRWSIETDIFKIKVNDE